MHQVAGKVTYKGVSLYFIVVNGVATRAYPLGSFLHLAEAAAIENAFMWEQTPFELGVADIEDWGVAQGGRLPQTDTHYLVVKLRDRRCAVFADSQSSVPVLDGPELVADYLAGLDDLDPESPSPF